MRQTFLLLVVYLLPALATADSWTAEKSHEYPAEAQENRIVKWCEINGSGVRYASANLSLNGFQPCGALETQASCDAVGKKFIAKSSGPYGYKDCALGKRIYISTEGPVTAKSRPQPGPKVPTSEASDPLSRREELQLKDELRKLEQENQPFSTISFTSKKDIEQAIKLLDPDEKKMIEQMFGTSIDSLLNKGFPKK